MGRESIFIDLRNTPHIPHYAADGGDGNHWRAVSVFYQCPHAVFPVWRWKNMATLTETDDGRIYRIFLEIQPTVMVDFCWIDGLALIPLFILCGRSKLWSYLARSFYSRFLYGTCRSKINSIFYAVILCGIIRIDLGKYFAQLCENYQRLLLAGGIDSVGGFYLPRVITQSDYYGNPWIVHWETLCVTLWSHWCIMSLIGFLF